MIIAIIILAKMGYDEVAFIIGFLVIIPFALFIIAMNEVFVEAPRDYSEFVEKQQYVEKSDNPILVEIKVDLNRWLRDAQQNRRSLGVLSPHKAEVLDLKPIE